MHKRIGIIGAGVSGLVAAIELEKAGYNPVIFEKSERVGGRIKTDVVNGIPLDHGFQVLLTGYPAAQHYLNYDALNLKKFVPGSLIFKAGKAYKIGDIMRDYSFLFSSLLAPIGTFADKRGLLALANELKAMSIETIFSSKETSTLAYLQKLGFSEKIIDNFFKPFYTGIFLEENLDTSSRKFKFIYKMFTEGFAAIPQGGMMEIPKQLAANLQATEFRFNAHVTKVSAATITLESGEEHNFEKLIIATESGQLLNNVASTEWHSSDCLYFRTKSKSFDSPIIGLVTAKDKLVNNIYFLNDVFPLETDDNILSVTVVKEHNLDENELIARVSSELKEACGIEVTDLINRYKIPRSLPKVSENIYAPEIDAVWYNNDIVLAGDVLANGSLNAALETGAIAAKAIIQVLGTNN